MPSTLPIIGIPCATYARPHPYPLAHGNNETYIRAVEVAGGDPVEIVDGELQREDSDHAIAVEDGAGDETHWGAEVGPVVFGVHRLEVIHVASLPKSPDGRGEVGP